MCAIFQKKGKIFDNLGKNVQIWENFENGQVNACDNCLQEIARIGLISIGKTASTKKLVCCMFLSSEAARYLYKSTIWLCMEYCYHARPGTPGYYLELLNKLRKWIFWTVDPPLATSLEPLVHNWNVASFKVFSIGIALVEVHLNWFHLLFLEGGFLAPGILCL